MRTTQRALLLVEGDVGLGDERLEPVHRELSLAEDPGEQAPVVFAAIHVEDEGALELRLDEDHDMTLRQEVGGDCPRRTQGQRTGRAGGRIAAVPAREGRKEAGRWRGGPR